MENRTENSRRYGGRWRKTQKIMKLCMLFLCAAFLQVSANTYSQEAKLDLKVNNASLEQVMNNIRRQSEFSFFFDDAAVKNISNITLDVRNARIVEALDEVGTQRVDRNAVIRDQHIHAVTVMEDIL